jgi:hypothetical protein
MNEPVANPQNSNETVLRLPVRWWSALIWSVGFVIRFLQVWFAKPVAGSGFTELERVAKSLATTGVLANPFSQPTGPTAHVAPGYPLLLSVVYQIFGTGSQGEFAERVLCAAASSLQYALLPGMAIAVGLPVRVGIAAGLVAALAPYKGYAEITGNWEVVYGALCVMLLFRLMLAAWTSRTQDMRLAGIRGIAWGISLLISPVLAPFCVGAMLVELWLFRDEGWRVWRSLAVMATCVVLLLAPWAIRNQQALGSMVWTRSNFGLEFSLSNNDQAGPLMEDNVRSGLLSRDHPYASPGPLKHFQDVGEVAFNRERMQAAVEWVGTHPKRFAKLTAGRAWRFWLASTHRTWTNRITSFLSLAGLLGFGVAVRRGALGKPATALFATLWILYPATYYLIQIDRRYRYPMEWTFLLPAMYLALLLAQRGRATGRESLAGFDTK